MENNTKHGIPSGTPSYQEGFFFGLNKLAVKTKLREWLEGYEDGLSEREGYNS